MYIVYYLDLNQIWTKVIKYSMKTAFNFLSKISLKKGFHFSKSHGSLVQD